MAAAADGRGAVGAVELREDAPLKVSSSGGGVRCSGGGPRAVAVSFAALSAGITLALLAQLYVGAGEGGAAHGSVAAGAAGCSRAGTAALRLGGGALDAAAVAALCLAIARPHRISLDASGALLYWEYRTQHDTSPKLAEWGANPAAAVEDEGTRPPRLVAALAELHADWGKLPWTNVLQTALDGAKSELSDTSNGVASIVSYLGSLQQNSSAELTGAWGVGTTARVSAAREVAAGGWRAFVPAPTAGAAAALQAALAPHDDPDATFLSVVQTMQRTAAAGGWPMDAPGAGVAAADQRDTYVALVAMTSVPFGSGGVTSGGWRRDEPALPLRPAPAILAQERVCGTRLVVGAESWAALVQSVGALTAGTSGAGANAVERPRVAVTVRGALLLEDAWPPPATLVALADPLTAPLGNATQPYAAVNVVQQAGDALTSHADSRGGGVASRF